MYILSRALRSYIPKQEDSLDTLNLDNIKSAVKKLADRKSEIETQKRELEFQIGKHTEQLNEQAQKVQELFGTLDETTLRSKLTELTAEANRILQEIEALDNTSAGI